MRITITFFIGMFSTLYGISQHDAMKRVTIGFSDNINLWLPGNYLNKDSELNAKKRSNTLSAFALVNIVHGEKMVFKAGPAFKRIGYTVNDRIIKYIYTTQKPGDPPVTTTYDLPTDYHARSLNLGIAMSLERKLPTRRPMYVGVGLETYLVEFYTAEYIPEKKVPVYIDIVPDVVIPFYDRFDLSNATVSVSYLYFLGYRKNLSAAVRANLGMNVHSAWDQFQKYAFLGLGLELGFGNVKSEEAVKKP